MTVALLRSMNRSDDDQGLTVSKIAMGATSYQRIHQRLRSSISYKSRDQKERFFGTHCVLGTYKHVATARALFPSHCIIAW